MKQKDIVLETEVDYFLTVGRVLRSSKTEVPFRKVRMQIRNKKREVVRSLSTEDGTLILTDEGYVVLHLKHQEHPPIGRYIYDMISEDNAEDEDDPAGLS